MGPPLAVKHTRGGGRAEEEEDEVGAGKLPPKGLAQRANWRRSKAVGEESAGLAFKVRSNLGLVYSVR